MGRSIFPPMEPIRVQEVLRGARVLKTRMAVDPAVVMVANTRGRMTTAVGAVELSAVTAETGAKAALQSADVAEEGSNYPGLSLSPVGAAAVAVAAVLRRVPRTQDLEAPVEVRFRSARLKGCLSAVGYLRQAVEGFQARAVSGCATGAPVVEEGAAVRSSFRHP